MSGLYFPNIDRTQDWYITTKDGLAGLKLAISGKAGNFGISDDTLDELFGVNEQQWKQFYECNLQRHELFSTLALFAACEGGVRRDFAWRISGKLGQKHHDRFHKLQKRAQRHHLAIAMILDAWKGAEKQNSWFHRHLIRLGDLFDQRNDLAHGHIGNAVAFDPVYEKLSQIRRKWHDAVDDFRGY